MSMLSSAPLPAPSWSLKQSGLAMAAAAALSTAAALESTLGGGGSSLSVLAKKAPTGSSACALAGARGRGLGGASRGLEGAAGARDEDTAREWPDPAPPA